MSDRFLATAAVGTTAVNTTDMPASPTAPGQPEASSLIDRLRTDREFQIKAAAAMGVLALGVAASDDEGTVLCPFRRCTDGYCPLCGATRSFGRLLRGDVAGAWVRHPYVVVLAVQIVVLGAIAGLRSATGASSGSSARRPLLTSSQRRWLLIANLVFVVGLWGLRLALGDIPRPSTLTFFGF